MIITTPSRGSRKPPPRGISHFMKPIYRNLIFFLILIATGCHGNRLDIVDYELTLSSTNSKTSISVVQISDLHFKLEDNLNEQVVCAVQKIKPDVIIFTGDMIDNKDNMAAFAQYIGAFPKAPHMFAILGNWEYWAHVDLHALEKVYSENGIKLLVNGESQVNIDGVSIRVIGLDDLLGGKPSVTAINNNENQIIIVLAHCPQLYDSIYKQIPHRARGVMLSGHTHGGQITFFGLPFQLPPGSGNYVSGLYHQDNFPLIVSKGIGTSIYNFRFFAQPDISHIIIRQ